MKIGIDVRAGIEEPAGIGKVVLNLVRQLAAFDQSNDYILYSNAPVDFGIHNPRFRVVVRTFGRSSAGRLVWHIFAVVHARFVARVDRFVSVMSLQASVLTKGFTVLIIPDLSNVLLPDLHDFKPALTGRFLLRRALRRARTIIAISRHTRDDILRYAAGAIPDSKVRVAYIACEEEFAVSPSAPDRKRVRTTHNLPDEFILFVGTVEPRKNLPTLIRAFAEVAKSVDGIGLVIAGRRGWKWEETLSVADASGVRGRIRFLEFVPSADLPALYAEAKVFVYPSLYEGFGIPALEAMTCGTPVIASRTSSLPEVTGDAALLIEPRDVTGLVAAIQNVLRDETLRHNLSEAGREQSRLFSWEKFAHESLEHILA